MEIIDPRDLLVDIARILKRLNIKYAVTGGMAVFVWERPRFTHDVDIIVKLEHTGQSILSLWLSAQCVSKAASSKMR